MRDVIFVAVFGFVAMVLWIAFSRITRETEITIWNYVEGYVGSAILLGLLWWLAHYLLD